MSLSFVFRHHYYEQRESQWQVANINKFFEKNVPEPQISPSYCKQRERSIRNGLSINKFFWGFLRKMSLRFSFRRLYCEQRGSQHEHLPVIPVQASGQRQSISTCPQAACRQAANRTGRKIFSEKCPQTSFFSIIIMSRGEIRYGVKSIWNSESTRIVGKKGLQALHLPWNEDENFFLELHKKKSFPA